MLNWLNVIPQQQLRPTSRYGCGVGEINKEDLIRGPKLDQRAGLTNHIWLRERYSKLNDDSEDRM